MLRLDRHIESLLTKYDCVILPGFGGFVTYHVSARIDEVGDVMLPPSTTVGFNPQLTLNDSLLVQSYVETYDYSFPEALHIVADEIRELESILQENGHYELPSIGQLTINIKGKYEFEPTPSGILIPEFYALPNIDIANKQDPVQSDFESDRQSGAQSGSDDDKVIKIRVRTLRRVAAIFIAILLISSIPFLSRNTSTNEILSSIDPFSRISGPTPRMSVSSPVLPDLQGSSKREQSSLSELPSVAETRHSQSGRREYKDLQSDSKPVQSDFKSD